MALPDSLFLCGEELLQRTVAKSVVRFLLSLKPRSETNGFHGRLIRSCLSCSGVGISTFSALFALKYSAANVNTDFLRMMFLVSVVCFEGVSRPRV